LNWILVGDIVSLFWASSIIAVTISKKI